MRLEKALRVVMSRWSITNYHLAQASGFSRAAIGKLIVGEQQTATWETIKLLADGFEKIDLIAKPAFIGALLLPEDAYGELDGTDGWVAAEEYPHSIKRVIDALIDMGLPPEEIDKLKARNTFSTGKKKLSLAFEEVVSLKMQLRRRAQKQEVSNDEEAQS